MSEEGFDEKSKGKCFYRCTMCGGVVSEWDIDKYRGCPKCANPRIKPTNLSIIEKLVQILKHPKVWEWSK